MPVACPPREPQPSRSSRAVSRSRRRSTSRSRSSSPDPDRASRRRCATPRFSSSSSSSCSSAVATLAANVAAQRGWGTLMAVLVSLVAVPHHLGLLPAVRSVQRRPHAREAAHGDPGGDGHRPSPHVHGRSGARTSCGSSTRSRSSPTCWASDSSCFTPRTSAWATSSPERSWCATARGTSSSPACRPIRRRSASRSTPAPRSSSDEEFRLLDQFLERVDGLDVALAPPLHRRARRPLRSAIPAPRPRSGHVSRGAPQRGARQAARPPRGAARSGRGPDDDRRRTIRDSQARLLGGVSQPRRTGGAGRAQAAGRRGDPGVRRAVPRGRGRPGARPHLRGRSQSARIPRARRECRAQRPVRPPHRRPRADRPACCCARSRPRSWRAGPTWWPHCSRSPSPR